ncbi:MAG TPA: hypothetical protein VJ720_07225, partial [Chitinophaga sp.]|nr:hypothetical protein [Chitinophaga sp.]
MNRMQFLKSGLLMGGAGILNSNNVLAHSIEDSSIDKLTDENGNFILNQLPYGESFLEPYMDAETLHLHHQFHHGGAVKGANTDIKMIRKAIDENSLDTVDFYTKKLSYHFG